MSKYEINPSNTIDGSYIITAEEKQRVEALIKEFKGDVDELKKVIISILTILGIWDEKTNAIKATLKSGEDGYIPTILKGVGDIMALAAQSQVPLIGKKAEKKLHEKFSFLENFIPLMEKHTVNV